MRALDDPGTENDWEWQRDRYITIRGGLIASRTLATWGAPEVAAYLAALHAEFYNGRGADRRPKTDGTGNWWRQLAWFNNPHWDPVDRVTLPFSTTLLEAGLRAQVASGLITKKQILFHPTTKKPLTQPRMRYWDHFDKLDQKSIPVDPDDYAEAVEQDAALEPDTTPAANAVA